MKQTDLIVAMGLTAMAGTLLGVYGGMVVSNKRIGRIADRAPDRILRHMIARMDLSEQQRADIDTIVFNVSTQIVALHESFVPKVDAAMETAFEQIADQLSDEQILQLKHEIERFEQHQRRLRKPRPPGAGPGGPPPRDPRYDGPPPPERDLGAPPPPMRREKPDIIISNLITQLEQLRNEDIPDPEKMHKLQRLLMPKRNRDMPPPPEVNGPGGVDMPIEIHEGAPGLR
jgi:hypothetical protein